MINFFQLLIRMSWDYRCTITCQCYSAVRHMRVFYPQRLAKRTACIATAVSLFSVKTRSHPSSRLSGYRSVLPVSHGAALRCVVFRWKHIRFAGGLRQVGGLSGRRSPWIELSKDARGCNKQLPVVYHIYPPRVQRANFYVRSSRDAAR